MNKHTDHTVISGKRLGTGEHPTVVFDWGNNIHETPSIPVRTDRIEIVKGQRVDLHQLSPSTKLNNEGKNPLNGSKPKQRTLTPPARRPTKPNTISASRKSGAKIDNSHTVSKRPHHLPGSTVPHLRPGSARTQSAAKWLHEEKNKIQSSKEDLQRRLEKMRQLDNERRAKASEQAEAQTDTDMQLARTGKDPTHSSAFSTAVLRRLSRNKDKEKDDERERRNVADRPFYARATVDNESAAGSTMGSSYSGRPAVPRLSKVVVFRSSKDGTEQQPEDRRVSASDHTADDVCELSSSDDEGCKKIDSRKGDALLVVASGTNVELPSPGVEIRLRQQNLNSSNSGEDWGFDAGVTSNAPAAVEGGEDEQSYGGDSDFEGDDEPADSASGENMDALSVGMRSAEHSTTNTLEIKRQKRKEAAREYLEQRRRKAAEEAKRKREHARKEEEARKARLENLDETRRAILRSTKKHKAKSVVENGGGTTTHSSKVTGVSVFGESISANSSGADAASPRSSIQAPSIGVPSEPTHNGVSGVNIALASAVLGDDFLRRGKSGNTEKDVQTIPRRRSRVSSHTTATNARAPLSTGTVYRDREFIGLDGKKRGGIQQRERSRSVGSLNNKRRDSTAAPRAKSAVRDQPAPRRFFAGSVNTISGDKPSSMEKPRGARSGERVKPDVPRQRSLGPSKLRHTAAPREKTTGADNNKENVSGPKRNIKFTRGAQGSNKRVRKSSRSPLRKKRLGHDTDMNAHIVDLISDDVLLPPRSADADKSSGISVNARTPAESVPDDDLIRTVREIMQSRDGSGNKGPISGNSPPQPGDVTILASRNEAAAARLMQSIDRLRGEMAGYSDNIKQIVSVRESTDEIALLRASIQSRLSAAISAASDHNSDSDGPPSPPSESGDESEGDLWNEGLDTRHQRTSDMTEDFGKFSPSDSMSHSSPSVREDLRHDDIANQPRVDTRQCEDPSGESLENAVGYRPDTTSPRPLSAKGRTRTVPSSHEGGVHDIADFPNYPGSHSGVVEDIDYGDILVNQQMGLLRDKREILRQFGNISQSEEGMGLSGDDNLVWGNSTYRVENVNGQERLVKTSLSPLDHEHRSEGRPSVPTLRNVGMLAGVLDFPVHETQDGGNRDYSDDYSDSDATSDALLNSSDDHRVVSIFANEIHRQRQIEAEQERQEEVRQMQIAEAVERAQTYIEHAPVSPPTEPVSKVDPSMYISPANTSAGDIDLEDRSISPRTYWDMMMARSTLPQVQRQRISSPPKIGIESRLSLTEKTEGTESLVEDVNRTRDTASEPLPEAVGMSGSPVQARSPSPAGPKHHESKAVSSTSGDPVPQKYSGAELRLMVVEELHRQEGLFNMAMELAEAEQTHTVHTASQAMQEITAQARAEAERLARGNELAQMHHAYEMSIATTTAEAALATQMELTRRDAALVELQGQIQQQGAEQEQLTYLAQTMQNINVASELLDMRQLAQGIESRASGTASLEKVNTHSAATMTDFQLIEPEKVGSEVAPVDLNYGNVAQGKDECAVRSDDGESEYSASFDQESRILDQSASRPPSVRFPDNLSSWGHASAVDEVDDGDMDEESYEMTFAEESHARMVTAPRPSTAEDSVAEVEDSIVRSVSQEVEDDVVGADSSIYDHDRQKMEQSGANYTDYSYSMDEYSEDQVSQSVPRISSGASAKAAPPLISDTCAPPESQADIIAEYLTDIDNRIKSQEKSISMRLQIEKRRMEHELAQLKQRRSPRKGDGRAMPLDQYEEAVRQVMMEYNASRAELERERWTANARAYKERRKYEQLRKDLLLYGSAEEKSRQSSQKSSEQNKLTSAALAALEASESYDTSVDASVPEMSTVQMKHKYLNSPIKRVEDSVISSARSVPEYDESFASIVTDNQGTSSQQQSYAAESFDYEDDVEEPSGEYSSEVFEALSTVEASFRKPPKPSKPTNRLDTSTVSTVDLDIETGLDSNVPSEEELVRRSKALEKKRKVAADIIRKRNEEVERRKKLIRIEEEEKEVDRMIKEMMRFDIDSELKEHRRKAQLEAKKVAETAARELKISSLSKKKASHAPIPTPAEKYSNSSSTANVSVAMNQSHAASVSSVDSDYGSGDFEKVDSVKDEETVDDVYEEDYSSDGITEVIDDEVVDEATRADSVDSVDEEDHADTVDDSYASIDEDFIEEAAGVVTDSSGPVVVSSSIGVTYDDDFEDEESTTVPPKSSRNVSYEYLSDFEDTIVEDAVAKMVHESQNLAPVWEGGHESNDSISNDTLYDLESSLELRKQRVQALKEKIDKLQTEKKLERLRAKQAERERLRDEEMVLMRRLKEEEEIYKKEKDRIMKGISAPSDEKDEDDMVVDELMGVLTEPLEAEADVMREEDDLAGDSWGSDQAGGFDVTAVDVGGEVTARVVKAEAATIVQARVRGFLARRRAYDLKQQLQETAVDDYSVDGDLVDEYKTTRVIEDIAIDDSFCSVSDVESPNDSDIEGGDIDAQAVQLAEMETAVNHLKNEISNRDRLEKEVEVDSLHASICESRESPLKIETNNMVFDEVSKSWVSAAGKDYEVDVSGFDDSDRQSESDSEINATNSAADKSKSSSPTSRSPSGQHGEGVIVEREVESEDMISDKHTCGILEESVVSLEHNGESDPSNANVDSVQSIQLQDSGRDTIAWNDVLHEQYPQEVSNTADAGGDGESMSEMNEDESGVDDQTIDTLKTVGTLETIETLESKEKQSHSVHEVQHETPPVGSEMSDPSRLGQSTDAPHNSVTPDNIGILDIAEGQNVTASDYENPDPMNTTKDSTVGYDDDYEEEFENESSEKSNFKASIHSAEEEHEESISVVEELEESIVTEDGDVLQDGSDMFEDSVERVGDRDVDRTMDSIGVDRVEDVRSPVKDTKSPVTHSEQTQIQESVEPGACVPGSDDVQDGRPGDISLVTAGDEEYNDEFEVDTSVKSALETVDLPVDDKIAETELKSSEPYNVNAEAEHDESISVVEELEESIVTEDGDVLQDGSDMFEDSVERVGDRDVDRTMDSIGVDRVEDVRSPVKDTKSPVTHSEQTQLQESVEPGACVPGSDDVQDGRPGDNSNAAMEFLKGKTQREKLSLASDITDALMRRLFTSVGSSPDILEMLQKQAPIENEFSNTEQSTDTKCCESVPSNENSKEDDKILHDYSPAESLEDVATDDEVSVDVEYEEDFEDIPEDSGPSSPPKSPTEVQNEVTALSLKDLPSLSKVGASSRPPVMRDSSLDDLLGADDDATDTPSVTPRFGKPLCARETDAFDPSLDDKQTETSVMDIWNRRKMEYIDELFEYISDSDFDQLVQDLSNPDFDCSDSVVLSEEIYFNIELRRVQNAPPDQEKDTDGITPEATQMHNKIVFDRVNEVLTEIHALRFGSRGHGPPATYNKRMIAQNMPLKRDIIYELVKDRLRPHSLKSNTITLEDGTTVVQSSSMLDNVKITALDSLRDEIQANLLDTAEYITDVILARMLVRVANIVIAYL